MRGDLDERPNRPTFAVAVQGRFRFAQWHSANGILI